MFPYRAPEGEASHTVSDQGSIGEFYRRAHAETGLTLVHHADAEAVAGVVGAPVPVTGWLRRRKAPDTRAGDDVKQRKEEP